jgi:hypothetical protein
MDSGRRSRDEPIASSCAVPAESPGFRSLAPFCRLVTVEAKGDRKPFPYGVVYPGWIGDQTPAAAPA